MAFATLEGVVSALAKRAPKQKQSALQESLENSP